MKRLMVMGYFAFMFTQAQAQEYPLSGPAANSTESEYANQWHLKRLNLERQLNFVATDGAEAAAVMAEIRVLDSRFQYEATNHDPRANNETKFKSYLQLRDALNQKLNLTNLTEQERQMIRDEITVLYEESLCEALRSL